MRTSSTALDVFANREGQKLFKSQQENIENYYERYLDAYFEAYNVGERDSMRKGT